MHVVRRLAAVALSLALSALLPVGAASAAETAGVPGTPCSARARACVDLDSDQAWLIRNGRVSYGPVPIAHGRPGYETPAGTFRVSFHSRHHVSSIYGSSMPWSVFFNRGIAFHQGDLGGQSHGCVRLSRSAAEEFYTSLVDGDVVQVV